MLILAAMNRVKVHLAQVRIELVFQLQAVMHDAVQNKMPIPWHKMSANVHTRSVETGH